MNQACTDNETRAVAGIRRAQKALAQFKRQNAKCKMGQACADNETKIFAGIRRAQKVLAQFKRQNAKCKMGQARTDNETKIFAGIMNSRPRTENRAAHIPTGTIQKAKGKIQNGIPSLEGWILAKREDGVGSANSIPASIKQFPDIEPNLRFEFLILNFELNPAAPPF